MAAREALQEAGRSLDRLTTLKDTYPMNITHGLPFGAAA